MSAVMVINKDGSRLMPTFNYAKVRKMLGDGRAVIYSHSPFTIRLTYQAAGHTQPVDYDTDLGYQHAGISIKSEKHEYVHVQADMLDDGKQMHDERRKYRRTRRNRLRYRAPRFDNRKKDREWIAPSLKDRMENQVCLFDRFNRVCPISHIHMEAGRFDTQVLEAVEKGLPLPEGKDYQNGPKYGFDTLREAVFCRDGYTCQCCGKSPVKTPGTILVIHHALFWKNDHTDRMAGLMTLCTGCHTQNNHQKNGRLWGLEPKTSNKAGAAFMNVIRWQIYNRFASYGVPVSVTYGAATKRERLVRNIEKTHANDAYCIGRFHPKHRCGEVHIKKRRRNNRILEKFYDAVYIDSRTGKEAGGKDLSSPRQNRKQDRHENSLRVYRKEKVSKGHRNIRKKRYGIRPGDLIVYTKDNKIYTVHGMQNGGKTLSLDTVKSVPADSLVPKKNKAGEPLPVEAGQKLAVKGKKEKHTVLNIDKASGTAMLRWYKGVRPEDVIPVTRTYGGWIYA